MKYQKLVLTYPENPFSKNADEPANIMEFGNKKLK